MTNKMSQNRLKENLVFKKEKKSSSFKIIGIYLYPKHVQSLKKKRKKFTEMV